MNRLVFTPFNKLVDWTTNGYAATVGVIIRFAWISVPVFLALLAGAYYLVKERPTGFIPLEDQGTFLVSIQLPDGASKARTTAVIERVEKFLLAQPEIEHTTTTNGQNYLYGSRTANGATVFARLRDWKERKAESASVEALLTARQQRVFKNKRRPRDRAESTADSRTRTFRRLHAANHESQRARPSRHFRKRRWRLFKKPPSSRRSRVSKTGFRINAPKIYANLDRERAKALGIPVDEVFTTLRAYLGTMYINDFYKYGRVYKVQLEGDPAVRMKPSDFDLIFVRNDKGNMIPLNTVVDTSFTTGPDNLAHFNGYDAIKVTGTYAQGVSSGETMAAIEALAAEKLYPEGLGYEWSDVSYQEKKAGSDSYKIFAFALLMVFLVLAAQYESWTIPLAVIVAVPVGVAGALFAIFLRGLPNDIYFQIGLITLIGLAAKNAILIVEFANTRVEAGMELVEATVEACRLRIRPIVMTSLAFILGVLPLVIATGAGAAGRRAIGTGVFGGMLAATFLAVLFVPLFFVLIRRVTRLFTAKKTKMPASVAE